MSWSQDYSVESLIELLIKLTGKHPEELLLAELSKSGISILNRELMVLDDGMFDDVTGEKITLSDGRVFIPKLTERVTENGNYGLDIYEYHLEDETPEVRHIGVDSSDPDIDVYDIPEEFGEPDDTGNAFPCGWDA